MIMRKSILALVSSLMAFSVFAQPTLPTLSTAVVKAVVPSVRPSQAVFYDGFDSGYNTPWNFFQGTHLFDTSTTNGVLRLNVTPVIAGQYAYVKGNWTNATVLSDIKLYSNSLGASVGLRYNFTNGSGYSAWILSTNSTTPSKFVLRKYNSWFNSSNLAVTNISDPSTNFHTVKLTATNNVITAYVDNILMLTYTDSVPLIPGGISLSTLGGNTNSVDFDNATLYDLNQAYVAKPAIQAMTKRIVTTQGNTTNIKVTATGTNITYKWYFGGSSTPIPNATNNTLVLSNATTANAGFYKVTLENLGGAVYGTANATVFTTNILPQCVSSGASVVLAWDYDFTNNPTVYSFGIYDGPASRNYTNTVIVTNRALSGTVTNLPIGVATYFAATARDTNGLESDYSSELSYVPPRPIITNFSLNIYYLSAFGYPAIQTKTCPYQSITFYSTTNLVSPWKYLTNVISDQYGNAVYDDVGAVGKPMGFYKASTP